MEDTRTQKLPSVSQWNRSWGIDFAAHTASYMEKLNKQEMFVYVEFILKNPDPKKQFSFYELIVIGKNSLLSSTKTLHKLAFFTEESIDLWVDEFVNRYEEKVIEILNS